MTPQEHERKRSGIGRWNLYSERSDVRPQAPCSEQPPARRHLASRSRSPLVSTKKPWLFHRKASPLVSIKNRRILCGFVDRYDCAQNAEKKSCEKDRKLRAAWDTYRSFFVIIAISQGKCGRKGMLTREGLWNRCKMGAGKMPTQVP